MQANILRRINRCIKKRNLKKRKVVTSPQLYIHDATHSKEYLAKTGAVELNSEKYIGNWKNGGKKSYLNNLSWKQKPTRKANSGSGWGKESWKERLKVSFVLHKNKLLELIQWSIALTRPMKLHFAGFATNMLKASHKTLAPALIWHDEGMVK